MPEADAGLRINEVRLMDLGDVRWELGAPPRLATPLPAAVLRRPEIAASIKSPCAMTLRILYRSSSQAVLLAQAPVIPEITPIMR